MSVDTAIQSITVDDVVSNRPFGLRGQQVVRPFFQEIEDYYCDPDETGECTCDPSFYGDSYTFRLTLEPDIMHFMRTGLVFLRKAQMK